MTFDKNNNLYIVNDKQIIFALDFSLLENIVWKKFCEVK